MPLATIAGRRAIAKAYGLFAGGFALLVMVIALVAQLGLDDAIIAFLVIAFTLLTFVVIGFSTRTLSLTDFYVAGRSVPSGFNGMATAAAFLSGGSLAVVVGAFVAGTGAALAVVVGWTAGFLVLAVAVAPYYRKSGAVTVPDFLAVRYGNPLLRPVAVIILLVSSFALLPAAIATGSAVLGLFLHLKPHVALGVILVTLLFSSLFGGMRSVTFVSVAQAILILLGVLVPVALMSTQEYGLPVPQVAYGFALDSLGNAPSFGFLATRASPLGTAGGINLLGLAVSLATGVVSLPHILARSGTVTGMAAARRSVAWVLVIVAAVAITAPSIVAFTRSAIVDNIVGVALDELPDWVFTYGQLGLLHVCGAAVATAADISRACGAGTVLNGLAAGDISLTGEGLALGFPDIANLPYVMSALGAAGILAATLATAGAVLMVVTATIGHDIYARGINRRASAGRRLILSRLVLVATLAGAGWLAAARPGDMLAYAFYAPSLAASGFFAPVVLGLWWNRTTWFGALAGMIAGFGVASAYIFLTEISPGSVPGFTSGGISGAASAFFAVPIALAVTGVISLAAPRPSESRLAVLAAIRRPSHDPILEDHAA